MLAQQRNALMSQIMASQSFDEMEKQELLAKLQQLASDVDVEYLHCLYFPECSPPARVPTRFGLPSAVFQQSYSYYINTGQNGSGIIGIAPQDTTWFSSFYSPKLLAEVNANDHADFYWKGEESTYIPEKFSHARLVGCSMRISYIGTRDDESGFLCSSHVFTSSPLTLCEQEIENGYFVTRKRPSEGVRMCWIPKSDDDMEFAPMEHKFGGNKDQVVGLNAWYSRQDVGDEVIGIEPDPLKLEVKQIVGPQNNDQYVAWSPVNHLHGQIAPSWYWGQHMNKGKSQTPQLMVCYFRGLPKNQDWLRVDVVRSFEALPRNDLKDYVAVKRRKENEKTLNFVKKKSLETKLHNHDLEDAKVLENHVKPNIHRIPDHAELVATTPKEDKSWWSRFTKTVGDVALDLIPAAGAAAGAYFGGPVGAQIGSAMGSGAEQFIETEMTKNQFGGTPYTGNPMYGSTSLRPTYATF